jgi:sugar phosphate isomerase/epimerase
MLYGAMNFPVKPILQELDAIAELGFDYFELTMDPPQAHYTTIRQQRNSIRKALERRGMEVVCHLPTFLGLADLTDSVREASVAEMLGSLEAAADLHAMKVVIHPGWVTGLGRFVVDQAREYGLRSLRTIVEKADDLGLTLCLENMFPRTNSLVQPEDFAPMFVQFPALRLTLDVGHACIGGKGVRRNLDFIDRFPNRLAHIHVSDNFGLDDNHLPIGAGTIDFPPIVKALKRTGYDGTVTLEIFSRDRDYLRISREKFAGMVKSA